MQAARHDDPDDPYPDDPDDPDDPCPDGAFPAVEVLWVVVRSAESLLCVVARGRFQFHPPAVSSRAPCVSRAPWLSQAGLHSRAPWLSQAGYSNKSRSLGLSQAGYDFRFRNRPRFRFGFQYH